MFCRACARRSIAATRTSGRRPAPLVVRPLTSLSLLAWPPPYSPPPKQPFARSYTVAATTSRSAPSSPIPPPPHRPPVHVTAPSLEAIKRDGFYEDDISLVPPDQAWINISPDAIRQLTAITAREPPDTLAKGLWALRVGVESGGCHGFQYIMAMTEERNVDDYVMQPERVKCIPIVIDFMSLGLMKGATLHHATELIGSAFVIKDNPQARASGNCGCGISWSLKE